MSEIETPDPNIMLRKKRIAMAIFGAIVTLGLIAGFSYRGYSRTHVSSDDAFIEGTVHTVSPRVAGVVKNIAVSNNQPVKAGDLLIEIDPDIYRQRLADAEASAGAEVNRAEELASFVTVKRTAVTASRASLAAREADRKAKAAQKAQAEIDLKRAQGLYDKKVISTERLERSRTQFDTASAQLESADSLISQARAALSSDEAQLHQAQTAIKSQGQMILKREAQAELERLQLSYTRLTSPGDGYVTRKSVELGNQVQAGQPLMSIVSLKGAYIVANYKETILHLIRPGMKVKIKFDAYPDREFTGKVDSIMAGTGSAFTLFPPENASGNYVKVVQRVPVKIVFDNPSEVEPLLRVGMSVVPTIITKE